MFLRAFFSWAVCLVQCHIWPNVLQKQRKTWVYNCNSLNLSVTESKRQVGENLGPFLFGWNSILYYNIDFCVLKITSQSEPFPALVHLKNALLGLAVADMVAQLMADEELVNFCTLWAVTRTENNWTFDKFVNDLVWPLWPLASSFGQWW